MLAKLARTPLCAMALAVTANLNLLWNGFVYDDGSQILQNPWLRESVTVSTILRIFSTNVWGFLGPSGISNYYRPFMHLLNIACFHLFAFRPWGYHLTSILIHAT